MQAEHTPDEERLKSLLMGRRVITAEMSEDGFADEDGYSLGTGPVGRLTLDDGTQLELVGHDGGCACWAGCYPLTELNGIDNVITNVELVERPDGDDYECPTCGLSTWRCEHEQEERGFYRVFVYAEDQRVKLASFDGSDGNGYYGTGWWLRVKESESV